MVRCPTLALAGMRHVSATLGRRVGGSTGTNFVGVLHAARRMREAGQGGSIVTILCDSGDRYAHSYYAPEWYAANRIDTEAADAVIASAVAGGHIDGLDPFGEA